MECFEGFQQIDTMGSYFSFREKQSHMKGEKNMKKLMIFIAVLAMISFAIGVIPAWSIDPQQLPPSASINKTIPGKSNAPPPCVPTTCEKAGAGASCGNIADGCGKTLQCGVAKYLSVTVDAPQYTGVCPKTLQFTGFITADKKGKSCYSWIGIDTKGYENVLINGDVMFDAAGSKKVSFEYTVPYNLPVNKQYMSFAADGAQWVKIYFKVECTKYLKVPNH
jgi:hypothetical protein